jgi:aspartate/methionine/tyrosine aminotransferase
LDLEQLKAAITSRTRAIVTISPNNPTGAVYSADVLTQVNQLCHDRGIYHISDEAYEKFVYGGLSHFSPASLPDSSSHTISLFSLSKAYGMAGWRAGFMVVPASLEIAIRKIQDTTLVCPPVVSQIAACAALRSGGEWCAQQIRGFQQVRDNVLNHLSQLGDRCSVPRPDGAFYVLVKLRTKKRDVEIVERLIREHRVAVMPGSTFGVADGCSLRIAYGAMEGDTVDEGMERLVGGLEQLLADE